MGQKPSSTWSVIDRWPKHEGLIDAFVECVKAGLEQIPEEDRHKVREFENDFFSFVLGCNFVLCPFVTLIGG